MYWQVYLHKTVLSAENTLIKILKRAKDLIQKGEPLSSSKSLGLFLKKNYNLNDFTKNQELLEVFSNLDDHDIYSCIKDWQCHSDIILSYLCRSILNRKPLKIKIQNTIFSEQIVEKIKQETKNKLKINEHGLSLTKKTHPIICLFFIYKRSI